MSRAAVAAFALAAALAGCGGERELTAQDLVAQFNGHSATGAQLRVGEALLTTEDAPGEVFELELEQHLGGAYAQIESDQGGHEHAGEGSLIVLEDTERALTEFQRCETAASLICYRAANVVLRFEALDASGQAVMARTLQAISDASR